MNRLALYLADFNRDYLSTPRLRRRTRREILKALATAAAIITCGLCLYLWELYR